MNCGCYCQPPAAMRVKVLLFLFVSWLLQASAQSEYKFCAVRSCVYARSCARAYVCVCVCVCACVCTRESLFVCWLLNVYLRDGSAQTIFTCCHTEIEVANQTFYLTQSQYTDTGPTSPSVDPIMQGAWQVSHSSANF